jgi:hypothetical protein
MHAQQAWSSTVPGPQDRQVGRLLALEDAIGMSPSEFMRTKNILDFY